MCEKMLYCTLNVQRGELMIDIHSHILPLVDDGSKSVDMSLEMLDQAYRDGTEEIILTPHLAYAYGFDNPREKIENLFEEFRNIVWDVGIPIKLHLGCEFLYSSKESFEKHFKDITTLADTKYLLVEFYFDVNEDVILEAVESVLEKGCIPVIAHPERFEAFQTNTELAPRIIEMGGYLQMNKGSILGDYGSIVKDTVYDLLDRRLIHLVGSDAHNLRNRYPAMYESFEKVKTYFGSSYAKRIFNENPEKLLNGGKV
mgnify:FL=1